MICLKKSKQDKENKWRNIFSHKVLEKLSKNHTNKVHT